MAFQVKKAQREQIYTKIALMSPSGGGKTYSALRLATGMKNQIEKTTGKKANILFANTESKRGYYYANEFDYDIVDIEPPHNPEKYVELIDFAIAEGYKILIIDSTSHEWEGKGGCLELQQQAGGTYQAWARVSPRHQKFIDAIAFSEIHVIATMRGKDQYEVEKDEKGKTNVKKLGVGAKQRDGFEYEFTCTFMIDQKTHTADVQKDNTHIFENDGSVILSESHGARIIDWANSGEGYTPVVRNPEPVAAVTENSLSDDVTALAKALYATHKDEVTALIKKYTPTMNPKQIKNEDDLVALKAELEALN